MLTVTSDLYDALKRCFNTIHRIFYNTNFYSTIYNVLIKV